MKTKLCDSFASDIAACAANAASLNADAATHIRECPLCRKKIAELRAVAAVQEELAAKLPEPTRRLSRRQLECALESGTERRGFAAFLRPAFAAAAALLVIAAVLLSRKPGERGEVRPAQNEPSVSRIEMESSGPTMAALRHEAQREQMFAAMPMGGTMRHYRVKDTKIELRN